MDELLAQLDSVDLTEDDKHSLIERIKTKKQKLKSRRKVDHDDLNELIAHDKEMRRVGIEGTIELIKYNKVEILEPKLPYIKSRRKKN